MAKQFWASTMGLDTAVTFSKWILPSGSYIENTSAVDYKTMLNEENTSEKFFILDTKNTHDNPDDDVYRLAISWGDYDKMNLVDKARVMLVVVGVKPYLVTMQVYNRLKAKYGGSIIKLVAGGVMVVVSLYLPPAAMAVKIGTGVIGLALSGYGAYTAIQEGKLKLPERA